MITCEGIIIKEALLQIMILDRDTDSYSPITVIVSSQGCRYLIENANFEHCMH